MAVQYRHDPVDRAGHVRRRVAKIEKKMMEEFFENGDSQAMKALRAKRKELKSL